MPGFTWLFDTPVDAAVLPAKLRALRTVGVPYTDDNIANAAQGLEDTTEADALIAYLQQLGTLIKDRR
jgi:cytochrome c oxidase cbb3-type subunit 2